MKKIALFFVITLSAGALFAEGVLFQFKHNEGDSSSYVSTVYEEVYKNGRLNNKSEIINRISSKVVEAKDGEGVIKATYMTTENPYYPSNTYLPWGEEFLSEFTRKPNGEMEISDEYFMPTIRNIPVFPDEPLNIGDTWTAEAMEGEDLRQSFGYEKPLIVPFTAKYKYVGDEDQSGTTFNLIEVKYTYYYETPVDRRKVTDGYLPASIMGSSNQIIYWNNEKGLIDHYTDNFKIIIENFLGDVFVFTGTSKAEITELQEVNNDENIRKIEQIVEELDIENISVKKGEKGLTISLDNIQFEPDSAVLLPEEKLKLKKLAQILQDFPNDLLVTGHTARRGSEQSCQQLSEERADTVSQYLKKLGVRDDYHIFTQGKGSKEPIATNNTEEGRMQNRRVEITILD